MLATSVAGVQHADKKRLAARELAVLREARALRWGSRMPYYHQVTDLKTGETRIEQLKATTREEADAELAQIFDDCPECRAARQRGEQPIVGSIDPVPPRPRSIDRFRRPRWRDLKRRVRR